MELKCAYCGRELENHGYISLKCDDGKWREFCNLDCAFESDHFDCSYDELLDMFYPSGDEDEE